MEKSLGNLSPEQISRVIGTLREVNSWDGLVALLREKPHFKRIVRGVPLNEDALAVLRAQLGEHKVYVFTFQGKPVDRCSTRAWKQAVVRAGIDRSFRWHDLRHTWASWHVQSGTRLQELMELGGWSSYEMVLRYAHLATENLREAACPINDTNLAQRPNLRLVHSR